MINSLRKTLFLLCVFAPALPLLAASEAAETLRAINWVENPTNHTRRGSRGELGPYQFLPQTWRFHTRKPFSLAVDRANADAVALKHYEWIRDGLVSAGIDPSPFNIALAWNCGLGAVTSGRVPSVSYSYAERVQNLVEQQRAHRAAAALAAATAETPAQPALPAGPAPMFDFSAAPRAPRFVVATTEPLYEPVVYTEKTSAVAGAPAGAASEKPVFAIGSVATPRFALIR